MIIVFQLAALCVLYILLRPIISGAVYFPTSKENVSIITKLADIKAGQKIIDLGSGDGRIVIALAKAGAIVTGYEINPILVIQSNVAIRKAGLNKIARVYWKSFWRMDLSKFDAVIVYGFPHIMGRLKKKLDRELKPGAKIISNQYKFPEMTPISTTNSVYLYIK